MGKMVMEKIANLKRMNFFNGFYTTAEDWKAEQSYHWWKMAHHNRGLHTPGILSGVEQELNVLSAGNRDIQVQPGAALDCEGREIFLGELSPKITVPEFSKETIVYITISFGDELTDRVENVQTPAYSGFTRVTEGALLGLSVQGVNEEPDNKYVMEVARIKVLPGSKTISSPKDPANPAENEIDRRFIVPAGSVISSAATQLLEQSLKERLINSMNDTRKKFTCLDARFPALSCADVRNAAVTMEMMARADILRSGRLADMMACLAGIENDAGNELGARYPALVGMHEYEVYVAAVQELQERMAGDVESILNGQDKVADAAWELSEVVMRVPDAFTGGNQSVIATGDEGKVTLDASISKVYGGRTIRRYMWDMQSSIGIPQAAAGLGQTVVAAAGDEAVVMLDAYASKVAEGQYITRYLWNLRSSTGLPRADAGQDRDVSAQGDAISVILDGSSSRTVTGEPVAKYRWDEV